MRIFGRVTSKQQTLENSAHMLQSNIKEIDTWA